MDINKNLVFLNSHPIQYFVPLYQKIEFEKHFRLTVLYCTQETIGGYIDKQFNHNVSWDVPLLENYKSIFLKNHSLKPSMYNGFWGLMNLGVIRFLRKSPKSIVVIHGWAYLTNILCIIAAKCFGHIVCLRAETPLIHEIKKNKLKVLIKHFLLKLLFSFIDYALYIGEQNKMLYKKLNISNNKLVFIPYCVDNDRFKSVAKSITREEARRLVGLPLDKKIILFSGKYISKKNPLDLLQTINKLQIANIYTVFVGEGELRPQMEAYIDAHNLTDRVILTGFVNQSLIPYYYAAADVFVMCSGMDETWGLSVNEAMNFGIPIIVSDMCGSAYDLVKSNGIVFPVGDIDSLALALTKMLSLTDQEKENIRQHSRAIMSIYSYDTIIKNLKQIGS